MAKCKSCGEIIDFIRTPAGKWIPVDPEPVLIDADTGAETFITSEGEVIKGREINQQEAQFARDQGETLDAAYVPHWATCPDAGRYRRKGAKT